METVQIDGVKAVAYGTTHVAVPTVPDHDSGSTTGLRVKKGIVEESCRRFVGSRILAKDDGVEASVKSTGMDFALLHLMEAVRTEVKAIATLSQIGHQLMSALHHSCLLGTEVKETVVELKA